MSALPKRFFTPEEYLELEGKAEYKSQYVAGEIFAMAGTQPAHNRVLLNIIAGLNTRFQGRSCDVYFQDIRLRVAGGDLYTYPDVMALCGEPQFEGVGSNPPSLLNPQVIFEVLSPSTEAFDRGDKFARYRRLDSLTDYVLVAADRVWVEHHRLQDNGVWAYAEHNHFGHVLSLAGIGCEMPLAEIYARLTLPGPRTAS
jgi:Uma2 family endonuclease